MKIRKRSDKNTPQRNESSRKQITNETQKRKAAKFHLEHINEIKRCETLITTKQNQKKNDTRTGTSKGHQRKMDQRKHTQRRDKKY